MSALTSPRTPFFAPAFVTRISRILVTIGLTLMAAIYAFPLVWMAISGLKTNQQIFTDPFALPETWDFSIWLEAWEVGNLGRYALNSAIVTGTAVTVILICASLAAFAFSRYAFKGKGILMGLLSLGLLLPLQSYFIAQSTMFNALYITNTRWALIIPYIAMGLPLATYLLTVYLQALPDELFEAARIEGASDFAIYRLVAIPLLRPGIATVAIFSALNAWNEFLLALLYVQDDALKTIPTGLLAFSSRYVTDYGLLFAALTIVTVPMIAIYVAFNRQIVEGITAGSLK
jgi:raffinose/stachyose/melibiose transport system permease protein